MFAAKRFLYSEHGGQHKSSSVKEGPPLLFTIKLRGKRELQKESGVTLLFILKRELVWRELILIVSFGMSF